MSNQLIDLNLFLPKFYPNSQQIQLKLNPLLDHIRSTNIVSYHQIQDKSHFSQQLQTLPHSLPLKPKPFNEKPFPLHQNNSIFDNRNNEFQFTKTSFVSHPTSENNRNKIISTLQTPDHSATPHRKRNDSFQVRSKTSDRIKPKKVQSHVPGTADLTQNAQQVDLQKLNIFIKNPENELDFDDDLCNYIRLKMLTKNPYFSGGKSSKIKKHLVQQINLQEIEKNFFKSNAYNTKYKDFFDRIMLKKKQNLTQIQRFNRTNFNTLSPKKYQKAQLEQRDEKALEKPIMDFNISKFSQSGERNDSPLSNKGFSCERSKKLTMKAKFLFRKSPIQGTTPLNSLSDAQDLNGKQIEIQIQEKAKSPTLEKYLETRKNKFIVHKDLMKRVYRPEQH